MLGDLSGDKCFREPGTREEALNSLYSINPGQNQPGPHADHPSSMLVSIGALKPNATASAKSVKKWNKKSLLAGKSPSGTELQDKIFLSL